MRNRTVALAFCLLAAACTKGGVPADDTSAAILADGSTGDDWPGYGRTHGEQHFSPLDGLTPANVAQLGLAWSFDLPAGNPVSQPIAVGGVVYTATGASVVRAIDAQTGKLLWEHDPQANQRAGRKMRANWGIRGLAWWNGRLYVGTVDGRLIALDAKDGREVWSAQTVPTNDMRNITGAPRILGGKVIIGHGGADVAAMRGYVTTYDAETGKQLWRFYLVPGNPADGFEDKAQEMAAKTWSGEWWKEGGGGSAWNAMAYDAESDTVFIGTGNGGPWNGKVRSAGSGDNLFLCSIVALNATTGAYKWHYQVNPGEVWDYNAAMDIHLADLTIDGKRRKVLLQAPKNGFLYVIDRETGKLISADPIVDQSWALGIDLKTGRPIERPEARYGDGKTFEMRPGTNGAHSWMPSAFSPQTGLMYVPVLDISYKFSDTGIDPKAWRRTSTQVFDNGVNLGLGKIRTSSLLAWDPIARKPAWQVQTPGGWSGGILATGSGPNGGLVFQGTADGKFFARDARTGQPLWSFDAQAPVLAPPITYRIAGKQYVTVLAGMGTTPGILAAALPVRVDYRTQARRVLTFVLGGKAVLPAAAPTGPIAWAADTDFRTDPASEARGLKLYTGSCFSCHSMVGQSGGSAPELGQSAVPMSAEGFDQVVRKGGLVPAGMPRFEELSDAELADLRQYIRAQVAAGRQGKAGR